MDTPLTDTDIRQWLPDCKILEYDWLENYESIDDLLPTERDYCFILYERENHVGHWICVMRNNKNIYHFDSFGLKPDANLNWISKDKRKELNCLTPYLSRLYTGIPRYKIHWNQTKYQRDDANTCGRWCILRILYFLAQQCDENGFKNWVQKWKSKGQRNDDFVLSVIT
jgi:hypothetical protein